MLQLIRWFEVSLCRCVDDCRIASNLLMAGVSIVPRSMSIEELHAFLKSNRLSCSDLSSRLACIACIEDFLIDSIKRTFFFQISFDRSLVAISNEISDIARKRFSAETLLYLKYPILTAPMLRQELLSRGIHPET